jgi:hypothetical protein
MGKRNSRAPQLVGYSIIPNLLAYASRRAELSVFSVWTYKSVARSVSFTKISVLTHKSIAQSINATEFPALIHKPVARFTTAAFYSALFHKLVVQSINATELSALNHKPVAQSMTATFYSALLHKPVAQFTNATERGKSNFGLTLSPVGYATSSRRFACANRPAKLFNNPTTSSETVAHSIKSAGTKKLCYALASLPGNRLTSPRQSALADRVTRSFARFMLNPLWTVAYPERIGHSRKSRLDAASLLPIPLAISTAPTCLRRLAGRWKIMRRIEPNCSDSYPLARALIFRLKLTFQSLGTYSRSRYFYQQRNSCTRVFKTTSKVFKYCYLNAS